MVIYLGLGARVCGWIAGQGVVFSVELTRPLGVGWFAIIRGAVYAHFYAVTLGLIDDSGVFDSASWDLGLVEFQVPSVGSGQAIPLIRRSIAPELVRLHWNYREYRVPHPGWQRMGYLG